MKAQSRIGITVAYVSIVFSTCCFVLYFGFTPIVAASAIFGVIGAVFAVVARAWRTAIVTIVFSLVPFAQLLVETSFETAYFLFLPAAAAIGVAALAIVDYSLKKRRLTK